MRSFRAGARSPGVAWVRPKRGRWFFMATVVIDAPLVWWTHPKWVARDWRGINSTPFEHAVYKFRKKFLEKIESVMRNRVITRYMA